RHGPVRQRSAEREERHARRHAFQESVHSGTPVLHVPLRLRACRHPQGQDRRPRPRLALLDRNLRPAHQDRPAVFVLEMSWMPWRVAEVPERRSTSYGRDSPPDVGLDLMSGLSRAGSSRAGESGVAMTTRPKRVRVRVLQLALLLTALFDLLALFVLV